MREIYPVSGVPDPSIVEGLYWRTHPQGRAWWLPSERAENPSRDEFYRNANASRVMRRDHPYEPVPFKPFVGERLSRNYKTFVLGGGSKGSTRNAMRRRRRALDNTK